MWAADVMACGDGADATYAGMGQHQTRPPCPLLLLLPRPAASFPPTLHHRSAAAYKAKLHRKEKERSESLPRQSKPNPKLAERREG